MSGTASNCSAVAVIIRILLGDIRRRVVEGRAGAELAETDALQIAVGLDDLSQAVFQRAVAAIGVGVVAFDQELVARLDFRRRGRNVQPERAERPRLHVVHLSPLRLGAAGLKTVAEEAERVLRAAGQSKPAGRGARTSRRPWR